MSFNQHTFKRRRIKSATPLNGAFNNRKRNKRMQADEDIHPNRFVMKAKPLNEASFTATLRFQDMPLNIRLKENIAAKGFNFPTEIQERAISYLLEKRDLLGIANTGTGKTGAFLIPIINRLLEGENFQSLIVVPTRELAVQVNQEFVSLARGLNLFSSCFIGGTGLGLDLGRLRKKNHVIVGTPGRLIDLMDRGALRLEDFSVLVLDEFDRMLDMGFVDDVKKMTTRMVKREQTMLFSATVDKKLGKLLSELLKNPVEIMVNTGETSGEHIEQDIVRVPRGTDKFDMLLNMVNGHGFEKVLIFAETKRSVDKVSLKLNKSGVKAELIHGDKSQRVRQRALEKFKKGSVQVLVATDVASRGLDVSDVTHVINYETPRCYKSYVHRIGRTGRAGKKGWAYTFVD